MSGWYRMHRGWMDHPVFQGEQFSRRDAFQWLVQEAKFKPTEVVIAGRAVMLERGQVCHSLRYLAQAWGWTDPRVRRFLKATQEAKIIDASADAGQTIITICNYDKYQAPVSVADAPPDAPATQGSCVADAKYKEGRKKEEILAHAREASAGFAFEGQVVRLTAQHFDQWAAAYHGIPDLRAELTSIDEWWQGRPDDKRKNWFHTTSGMLNRKHQAAIEIRSAAGDAPLSRTEEFRLRKERWERDNPDEVARYVELDRLDAEARAQSTRH